jgi:hypothetical protein
VLLRSGDRGRSWTSYPVPDTNSGKKPYIAAVDRRDADTVYVRTTGLPGRLFVTRDGGEHFDEILRLEVPIQGFALSPDGQTVLATNVYDGSFRADTDSFAFEKIACRGPSCLLWNELGLFGCGDDLGDGFIVGRSEDAGETFTHVLNLSCVRGPLACEASSAVGGECPAFWPDIRTQLGAESCVPASVPPYTGCFAAAGNGGSGTVPPVTAGEGGTFAGVAGDSQQGSAGDPLANTGGGGRGAPETAGRRSEGCACSLTNTRNHSACTLALLALFMIVRRRATRRRPCPTLPAR